MKTRLRTEISLIPIDGAIASSDLWTCMDNDSILKFSKLHQIEKRAIQIGRVEYGEVNFERKSDWMRFLNKMDKYDYSQLNRIITGKNKSLDYGDYIISRADIEYSEDGFAIKFKEPIDFIIEKVGDHYLVIKVKEFIGKFTYEWLFTKNSDIDVATICEIYIYDTKIIE